MMPDAYEEMLRADRAELALAEATRKLAYLLEVADSWEESWGGGKINTDVAVASMRQAVRGFRFAP